MVTTRRDTRLTVITVARHSLALTAKFPALASDSFTPVECLEGWNIQSRLICCLYSAKQLIFSLF